MVWPEYGQLSRWLSLFGENVAVGMIVIVIYASTRASAEKTRSTLETLFLGFLFGGSAIVSMLIPVLVADGVHLDARNLFVLVGSMADGPLGALVATLMPAAYRVYLGGGGLFAGTASIICSGLLGAAIQRRYGTRVREFGVEQFALIGLIDAAITIAWPRVVFAIQGLSPMPGGAEITIAIVFPAATAVLGSTIYLTHYRVWLRSQRRLSEILQTLSEIVWETDEQERFTYVSARFQEILGFDSPEILGRTAQSLGGHLLDDAMQSMYDAAFAARKPYDNLHYVPPTKDGQRKIVSISGRPVFDAQGIFRGYRGTATDITERESWRAIMATISDNVDNVVGQDFLNRLTKSVADVLGAQGAMIGSFQPATNTLRTVVRLVDGRVVDNRTVDIAGMPAEEVLQAGKPLVIRSGLIERYPRFGEMTGASAQAYAATPLIGSRGQVLGILSAAFDTPLTLEHVETVIQLFAGRAAAEIERMEIEDEWRGSRDRLITAQRIGMIASIEADLVRGISIWSDELWALLGVQRTIWPPSFERFMECVHPDDRDMVRGLRHRSLDGHANDPGEFRIVRPNGEVRWLYRQAEMVRGSDGKPIKLMIMLQDITDRRRLEYEERRSREHLSLAQLTAGIGSAEVNLLTGEEYWSEELQHILGVDGLKIEFTFRRFLESVHPDDRERLRALRTRNNVGAPTDPIEFRVVRPNGQIRWLRRNVRGLHDATDALIGLIATHQDITERRIMEESLRSNYESLQRAQRMGQIGSAEIDLVYDTAMWSDEQLRIYGLDPAGPTPNLEEYYNIVHPDDRAMVRATRLQDNLGNASKPLEFRIIRPDGVARWIHREVDVLRDPTGKPVKLYVVHQDITERKRLEDELRSSAQHLAAAQRVGKMASVERDVERKRTVWSMEAFHLFGIDPLHGQPTRAEFLELIHPDDRARMSAVWDYERQGHEVEPFEYRLMRSDGEMRWIYRQSEFVRDGDGTPTRLIMTHQDVTAREEMRRLMATLSGNFGNAIGEDFLKALVVSVARVLGADYAYIGRPNMEDGTIQTQYLFADGAFVANSSIPLWEASRTILASGRSFLINGNLRGRFPEVPPILNNIIDAYAGIPLFSAKGELLGLLVVSSRTPWERLEYVETVLSLSAPRAAAEIERLANETEARRSRKQMAEVLAALDIARDAIIMADGDRRIAYLNDAAVSLLGLPGHSTEMEGRRLDDFQSEEIFGPFGEEILAALMEKGEWQGTGPWRRPSDNREMFFDARIHRLPQGGFVAVASDATKRIRLEDEERRRQEWQAQASKLEALGNLAGGIAHDFNNLLGAILGFGQFLVEDLDAGSEPHHFAERIVSVSQRGRSLVQQILTFARRGPVEAAQVKLAELVEETHDLLRATLPATTELVVENRLPQASVLGDRGQLSQVFVNLCVNGSDALGGRQGKISVVVATLDRRRPELAHLPMAQTGSAPAGVDTWADADGTVWIATGSLPLGPIVSIAIMDTGAGIPSSVGAQIFEPFFTTKGRGRGTGLGLAVVHRIVLEHAGGILVKTRQERGTTFELLLPLSAAVSDQAAPSPPVASDVERDTGASSILVVDDDESFCAMVETALKRLGYSVQSTIDPRIAQSWLKNQSGRWDVLVTDQNMPHINGEELIRYFKAHSPATRTILCTGNTSGMTEQRARMAGADGFLMKPFDFDQLGAMVSQLLQNETSPTG
ncbi:MAG TPA: PAS domain-containing protein [Magnetospirillaceae bacterium]|jgi:PAS domain S-box-containing protein